MSSTSFRSNLLVLFIVYFIVIDVINSRPIRSSRDVVKTSKWSSADSVDDLTVRIILTHGHVDTRSGPDNCDGVRAHDTRRVAGRDLKHGVAKASAAHSISSGMTRPPFKDILGEPFIEDYSLAKSRKMCCDRFGDVSWTNLLYTILITMAFMASLVIVYLTVISCSRAESARVS